MCLQAVLRNTLPPPFDALMRTTGQAEFSIPERGCHVPTAHIREPSPTGLCRVA